MSDTIIGLPIGSTAEYAFVFKDDLDQPIDLTGAEFIITLTAKYPTLSLEYDTTADPARLFIEELQEITPVGKPTYTADRLMLVLTPAITRQIPPGALTRWEIERRDSGSQRNWGSGLFRGYGGSNSDV